MIIIHKFLSLKTVYKGIFRGMLKTNTSCSAISPKIIQPPPSLKWGENLLKLVVFISTICIPLKLNISGHSYFK